MIDRLLSAFVAVSLASLIWLYARSRDQETLDHVPIPVEVTLGPGQSDQYTLEVVNPAEVLATFTGPPARIRELRSLLQRDRLRVELTFNVPSDRMKENRIYETLLVENSHVHTPPGVSTVLVAGRNQVRIVLDRVGEKRLPVRLDPGLTGCADARRIDPPSVLVHGPMEVLQRARAIPTQPATVSAGNGPVVTVPLVRELEGRPIECEPENVQARLLPPSQKKTHEVADVPVRFLTPAGFAYRPRFTGKSAGRLTLHLIGPADEETPHVLAYVDLTGQRFAAWPAKPATHSRPVEETVQVQLPPGFTLEEGSAPSVTFELIPNTP
jgi:hypothetical protein